MMAVAPLLAWLAAATPAPAASAPPPNVVLIIADDLGLGEVSSYGSRIVSTPNIDALARDGVRLSRFYVAEPICSPSRAALLTGRNPLRYKLGGAIGPGGRSGLPASEKTLADVLGKRGYATGLVGKWHLGITPEFFPTRHGFQEFYGLLYGHGQSPIELYHNEQKIETPARGPEAEAFISGLTQRYTREAVRFMEASRARPFLLVLAEAACHSPAVVSREFRGRSGRSPHDDSIVELDWSVGEVSAALARLGLEKRTIVIFVSDNGSPDGDGNGSMRGGKWTILEGGIRVPFIVRWTGTLPAGRVENRPASAYDLLPTLVSWTGAERPGYTLEGRDVSEMLAGRAAPPIEEFLWAKRAFISGRWKLAILKGTPALYDLEADPGEKNDVIAQQPEIAARLQATMAAKEAALRADGRPPVRPQRRPRPR